MFMALELDRSNLAQAVTDNLLKELKMNTNGTLAFKHVKDMGGLWGSLANCLKITILETRSLNWHFYALSCRLN